MLVVVAFVNVDATTIVVLIEPITFRTMTLVRSIDVLTDMTTVVSIDFLALVHVLAYGTTFVDFITDRTLAFEVSYV